MIGQREPRVREPDYMAWVAKLPCVACMVHGKVTWGVHVAHLRAASEAHGKRYTGKAEKPSDCWTLPLCPPHHTGDVRRARYSQHSMGELDFWAVHGVDPFGLCIELHEAFVAGAPQHPRQWGVQIITKAAAAGRRQSEGAHVNEDQTRAYYADLQKTGGLPTVAISIKQPWAWLIVNGWKDVENRDWRRKYPAATLVHASKKIDEDAEHEILTGYHPANPSVDLPKGLCEAYTEAKHNAQVQVGGFVGTTGIIGCHEIMSSGFESDWFVGTYGYQLSGAKPLPFLPWRGALGFFPAKVS